MRVQTPEEIRVLTFREHEPRFFDPEELPEVVGGTLWREYSDQIEVEFPSRRTEGRWKLTPKGWVGHVPVGRSHALRIEPKVPIGSLFQMLEYAYGLKAFRFSDEVVRGSSIDDFFNQLARLLARSTVRRAKKGLHRSYEPRTERLSFIRGRMNLREALRRPARVRRECTFQENTADVEDNQILLWTLRRILHTGALSPAAKQHVYHAYRTLAGTVSVEPFRSRDCRGRSYTRLTRDYQPLHALCAFFLDHTGPQHDRGGRGTVPFLINMWELFEGFVAEWLKEHLPSNLSLETQVPRHYDPSRRIPFRMDVLISDAKTKEPLLVLDTKYKDVGTPRAEDVAQVVSYAVSVGAPECLIAYPGNGSPPRPFRTGSTLVTGVFIPLQDPERGMEQFMKVVLSGLREPFFQVG